MVMCYMINYKEGIAMEQFIVSYQIEADSYETAKMIAWSVQVEQTIEFPYELVTDPILQNEVVGQLVELSLVNDGFYLAKIAYNVELTAFEVTQFLNVVFGNSSLQPHIWVVELSLPKSLLMHFGGPRFGLSGLRTLLHVPKRPMIQAVIKPLGSNTNTLAKMCQSYTLGGVDVIKDDHGITNQCFSRFVERVKRCADSVHEGNEKIGGHTLYAANISSDGGDVLERAYKAKELGATALMITPGLVGFGWLQALAKDESLGLPIISHPAMLGGFALPGTSGIADYLWLGLLPRLFGADMPVFVSYGGRFTFTAEQCKKIHHYSIKDNEIIRSACPAPGGGVTDARLDELLDLYGPDTMFLIGGDMFRYSDDLQANMEHFIDRMNAYIEGGN